VLLPYPALAAHYEERDEVPVPGSVISDHLVQYAVWVNTRIKLQAIGHHTAGEIQQFFRPNAFRAPECLKQVSLV